MHGRLFIASTTAEELKRHLDLRFHRAPLLHTRLSLQPVPFSIEGVGCVCGEEMSCFFSSGVKRLCAGQGRLNLDMGNQTVNMFSTHTLHLFIGANAIKQCVMKHLMAGPVDCL